jgi:hypothetical protein
MRESSLGANKKCGDGGISCGLFQYREGTWNDFTKKYNPPYKDKSNYVDQTVMTVLALKDKQYCHWGPLREKYGCGKAV